MCRSASTVICFFCLLSVLSARGQKQDVEFHPAGQFLSGKKILKVKRDFSDPYLWVLAQNNEIYRLNSITLAVDDYTPQFAAYNNLQFIDIAGLNQDTVFVATNSTNVIEYKKGALRTIGQVDGLADTVNSVGISNFAGDISPLWLEIGTTKGRGQYNPVTEQMVYNVYDGKNGGNVYEASYRAFTGNEGVYLYYAPSLIPVSGYGIGGGAIFEIAPVAASGTQVNSAFTIEPYLYSVPNNFFDPGVFWGNENGLFQEQGGNLGGGPYGYYLKNIKVNKITDIDGFASLGDPSVNSKTYSLLRENLLIGTNNGLYFSSSFYDNLGSNFLYDFSLFQYNALGNLAVNDICVNGTANQYDLVMNGCETGVWLACDNGLYLIKPDYPKYLDPNARLQSVQCGNLQYGDTATTIKICGGDTARFYLPYYITSTNMVQWAKDGIALPGQNGASLAVTVPGDYNAIIHAPCENVSVQSNHFKVQVTTGPVFSFNYPDKLQYCDTASVNLKTDNNPKYHYRWYMNGVLNGDTVYNYNVTQSGKYKVEVGACTNSWVPSKEIEVDLVNLPVPVVAADKAKYCGGDTAKLTVNVPADPDYTIGWYKDGSLITADNNKTRISVTQPGNYSVMLISTLAACSKSSGNLPVFFTSLPVFAFNYPDKLAYCNGSKIVLSAAGSSNYHYRWYFNSVLNGDTAANENIVKSGKYKVEVSACEGSWVPSKEVQVDMIALPVPAIKTDKASYCTGDNATMSIAIPANPAYTIHWYKDNAELSLYQNQTSLNTNIAGNYTVMITSNEINTDGTVCSETSGPQKILFNPVPSVTIQQIAGNTLCDGQSVGLKAVYTDGTVTWSTGETGDHITVAHSGTYTASVTSAVGCSSNASTTVEFFPNPLLKLSDAGVCVRLHKTATLTAPAGMATYLWNGQPGSQTYEADHPQIVTLTVIDANGCQASQNITISDDCPDMVIPNAFTPNGDGINDLWGIQGLEDDPTALVKIYTRNGQEIYESRGYAKAWDGTYKARLVPSGVYYYLITTKNGSQTFTGSVTVIY